MNKIKVCLNCGKEYIPTKGNQKYCSAECKKIVMKWQQRQAALLYKEKTKKSRLSREKIDEIAVKARKAGMSYGKYVSLIEMRKEQSKHESKNN